MNIVYVITGLTMGGAEKQVCLLASKMSERGHNVTLVSLQGCSVVLPESGNVTVIELKMNKNPLSFIKSYLKLCRILKSIDPDVVHSHLFHANIMCRLSRVAVSYKKLISSAHSRNEGGVIRMFLYRLTDRFADLTTNVSQDAVNESLRRGAVPESKIKLVFNGLDLHSINERKTCKKDLKEELNINRGCKLLLSVGRFTKAKDYPNLLNAFKILYSENKFIHMAVAGHGELYEDIKQLALDLDISSNVHFLGVRNDIPALMNASDIYVMSSEWEGLPLVVGEAMACEKIVVTTNCGGVKEILGDEEFIVPVKSPQLLADAISQAIELSDDEIRIRTNKAKARLENYFSIESIVNTWLNLYH